MKQADQTGSPIDPPEHTHEWRMRGSYFGDPPTLIEVSCDGCGEFAWYNFESMSHDGPVVVAQGEEA